MKINHSEEAQESDNGDGNLTRRILGLVIAGIMVFFVFILFVKMFDIERDPPSIKLDSTFLNSIVSGYLEPIQINNYLLSPVLFYGFLSVLIIFFIILLITLFSDKKYNDFIRKFIYIFISLSAGIMIFGFILFLSSDSEIGKNPINETSSYLGYIQGASASLMLSIGSLFLLSIIILCFYYIRKDIEEAIVLPFETNSQDLNGRVISDMIIAELRRIKDIHDLNEREGLKVAKSERLPVPREDSSELVLSDDLKRLGEELGEVSAAISDVSKFTLSGIEIPISSLVLAINRVRRPGKKGCIIHGTVQKYGSRVHVEVHIRKRGKQNIIDTLNCQVERNLKNDDISELMRDLAYKIAYKLYDKSHSERAIDEFKVEAKDNETGICEPEHLAYAFKETEDKNDINCHLKNFLKKKYGNWVETTKIIKNKNISNVTMGFFDVSSKEPKSIRLKCENTEVILEIYDVETEKFIATDKFKKDNIGIGEHARLNNIDESLNHLGMDLMDIKVRAEKLKCKLDVCQKERINQNKTGCIDQRNRYNYNWLFELNDLANPAYVADRILYEVGDPIPPEIVFQSENPISLHIRNNHLSQFEKLENEYNKYGINHSKGKDDLNDCLIQLLNMVIESPNFDSNLTDNIIKNHAKDLRPETKRLYEINRDSKRDDKGCYLLKRLLLEDLLDIKFGQQSSRVKTWDELKYITEALHYYNLHMNSKRRDCLDRAYEYCDRAAKPRSKIFFGVFYNIAIAYFEIPEYERAEKMFQNAAKIKPIASAHAGRGICLKYRTRFGEALKEFEYAICHENTLASLKPLEAARLKIRKHSASSLERQPNSVCFDFSSLSTSWDLFGGVYLDLGFYVSDLYNNAIVGLYEAIKRDPISPYPWLWLGIAYYRRSAISYRNAKRAILGVTLRNECIKEAKNDIRTALNLLDKAIELGTTQGLKYFASSPMGRAACLRLSMEICTLYKSLCPTESIDEENDICDDDKLLATKREACEILATIYIDDAYNRACHESIDGRTSEAEKDLKISKDNKRISRVQALFDPDLYLFMPGLENFLKDWTDNEDMIKDIRQILSGEDKYIQSSFEAAVGNRKKAIRLFLEKRNELKEEGRLKKEAEEIISKKLEHLDKKFSLDPNFLSLQNIAVVSTVSPKSPTIGSKIMVNIEIINTSFRDLKNLCIKAIFPRKIRYLSASDGGNPSNRYVKWIFPNLNSWKKHYTHLFACIDYLAEEDQEIIISAKGDTCYKHAFYWDEIPKTNCRNFSNFLEKKLNIQWARNAKIVEIDKKTFKVSAEEKSLSLKLYANETKVFLKIYDGKTYRLKAERKDCRIAIYNYREVSNRYCLIIKVQKPLRQNSYV